jgi:hypothetical protein
MGEIVSLFGRHPRGWTVYCLMHRVTGKMYVGMSSRLLNRLSQHKSAIGKSACRKNMYSDTFYREVSSIRDLQLFILARPSSKQACRKEEDYQIRYLKPEYNLTDNGNGVSEKRRETSRRTIKIALQTSGQSSRVRVRCLSTKESFDSIRDAAAQLGIPEGSITDCCRGRLSFAGGLQFEYIDKQKPPPPKRKRNFSGVVCVETQEFFKSANSAAKSIGIDASGVIKHLNGLRGPVGGYTFVRVHDSPQKQ